MPNLKTIFNLQTFLLPTTGYSIFKCPVRFSSKKEYLIQNSIFSQKLNMDQNQQENL